MHVALLFVKYFGVMSATLQSWGCAGEFSNSWSQSCSMICLTTEMSDFLLPAVFGDQTLLREAEVALGPSLMLLISLPAEEKKPESDQNLLRSSGLKCKPEFSGAMRWKPHYLCCYKVWGCIWLQKCSSGPLCRQSYGFQKKELFTPFLTFNYLTFKSINCLLFSFIQFQSFIHSWLLLILGVTSIWVCTFLKTKTPGEPWGWFEEGWCWGNRCHSILYLEHCSAVRLSLVYLG